jgi:hypothetical protein
VSQAGRNLQVGDYAYTDYRKGWTLVRITERIEGTPSQSRICFRVDPPLEKYDLYARYDADWFEPAPGRAP